MTQTPEVVTAKEIRVGDSVKVPRQHFGSHARPHPDHLFEADCVFKRVARIEQHGPGFAYIFTFEDGDLYNWPPEVKTLREVARWPAPR